MQYLSCDSTANKDAGTDDATTHNMIENAVLSLNFTGTKDAGSDAKRQPPI
jgi:hypothetical protein